MIRVLRRRGVAQVCSAQGAKMPKCPLGNSDAIALRSTRVLLLPIPPQLLRAIAVGGLFVLDALMRAHNQQVRKMEKENEGKVNPDGTVTAGTQMTPVEALQVLGLNEGLAVPLRNTEDVAKAKRTFEGCFEKARLCNSPYLQGKFSAAYKMCVDETWEAKEPGDQSK